MFNSIYNFIWPKKNIEDDSKYHIIPLDASSPHIKPTKCPPKLTKSIIIIGDECLYRKEPNTLLQSISTLNIPNMGSITNRTMG